MKVAIHGKPFSQDAVFRIEKLFQTLLRHRCVVSVSENFSELLHDSGINHDTFQKYSTESQLVDMDFFISIGGDGTLLQSITHINKLEIPILAINTGTMGFLANTTLEDAPQVVEDILRNSHEIDSRMLIHADCGQKVFEGDNFALNEFAVLKQDTSSMITVNTYLDGNFLNSYWADGLIISTPTGSTGYSLSCGGPIVSPQSNSFIITPVSPHNLNVRPFVVSDKSVISLEVKSRSKYFLVSLDSRSATVSTGLKFTIRKESFEAKLIKTGHHTFMDTLRKKLNWGIDMRN